jgi:transcriptional regulator with XRE-family HTH domain
VGWRKAALTPPIVNVRSRPDPVLALVLVRLRTERGLSPDALAEAAGMTTAAYRQLEGSLTVPAWTTVRSIADALGVSMAELGAAVDREPERHLEQQPMGKEGR